MDSPSKSENYSHHPDLPNIPCPRNLFISLLSKKYLTALYLVEPSMFPQNWRSLLKISPMGAWNALNNAVIQYLNTRYSKQGLHIGKSETAILTLAQRISENIVEDIRNGEGTSSKTQQTVIPHEGEFDLVVEKLRIVFDIVSDQIVKLTGKQISIHISTDKVSQRTNVPKTEAWDVYL